MRRILLGACGLGLVLAAESRGAVELAPIGVGTGADHGYVQVDFSDGASFLFDVKFDGPASAFDLVSKLDTQLDFDLEYSMFGDSGFVTGMSYQGHTDIGDGSPMGEGWWHNWAKTGGAWELTMGASGVTMADGDWNGWNFQAPWPGDAPRVVTIVPEPGGLALAALGGVMLARRRRVS